MSAEIIPLPSVGAYLRRVEQAANPHALDEIAKDLDQADEMTDRQYADVAVAIARRRREFYKAGR